MGGISACGFVLLAMLFFNQLIASTLVDASRQTKQPSSHSSSPGSKSAGYIVYTMKSPDGFPNGPEAYYTHILSKALGSKEAAKKSLLYSYHMFSGFSAKLTDKQVSLVKKQPEVLEVNKSQRYYLVDGVNHDGTQI